LSGGTFPAICRAGKDLQWWSRAKKGIATTGTPTDEELPEKQRIEQQMMDEELFVRALRVRCSRIQGFRQENSSRHDREIDRP
jgi:hypothetical protein